MLGTRITRHTQVKKIQETWHVIDANGKRLGRLASEIAMILMGKHKPDYSRHMLSGDFVVVVNASRVEVSGNPSALKTYYRHTGYVGNLKKQSMRDARKERPERVIERTVKGMLPGNKLGRRMERRLKVYAGPVHPHEAQVNAGKNKSEQTLSEQSTLAGDTRGSAKGKRNQGPTTAIDDGSKSTTDKRTGTPKGPVISKQSGKTSRPPRSSNTFKQETTESTEGTASNDTGTRRRRTTK